MLAIFVGGLAMYYRLYRHFCGNLIKAAVSRQCEYLADASAVQYTRNPNGIAGALKKIGGFHAKIEAHMPPRRATFSSARFLISQSLINPPATQRSD